MIDMKAVVFYLSTFIAILGITTFSVIKFRLPPLSPVFPEDSTAVHAGQVAGQGVSPVQAAQQPAANQIGAGMPKAGATGEIDLERTKRQLDSLQQVLKLAEAQQRKKKLEEEKAKKEAAMAQAQAAEADSGNKQRPENFDKMTKEMAQIYENMPPAQAAMIIANLEKDVAITVLSKMKKRQAAKIMAAMEPYKAIELSKLMAER